MSQVRQACLTILLSTALYGATTSATTPPIAVNLVAQNAGAVHRPAPTVSPSSTSPQGARMTPVAPARSAAAVHVMQQLVTFLVHTKSSEELTPENVGRQFGVTLAPEGEQSIYRSPDLGGGWNYGIGVSPSNKSMKRGFSFWLYNPQPNADHTPICVLSLDDLRKQLVAHGFVEKFTPSEIGGVDWVNFVRNDIVLTITRRDLLITPQGYECFSKLQTTDGR